MTTATVKRLRLARLGFSMLLAAFFGFAATAALADHGSWTDHDLHWWEEGPSQYGSYADVDASNAYDYGHARWERWTAGGGSLIEYETVTCSAAEGCDYRKTFTQYFEQSSYRIKSVACANDGSHELTGVPSLFQPCASLGLEIHEHFVDLS